MQGFQGHRSWTYRGVMAGRTQSATRNWYGLKSLHKHGPLHGVCFTQASARAEPQNFAQYGFVTEIGWGGISQGVSLGILRRRFLCDCNTSCLGYGSHSLWMLPVSLFHLDWTLGAASMRFFFLTWRTHLSFSCFSCLEGWSFTL